MLTKQLISEHGKTVPRQLATGLAEKSPMLKKVMNTNSESLPSTRLVLVNLVTIPNPLSANHDSVNISVLYLETWKSKIFY